MSLNIFMYSIMKVYVCYTVNKLYINRLYVYGWGYVNSISNKKCAVKQQKAKDSELNISKNEKVNKTRIKILWRIYSCHCLPSQSYGTNKEKPSYRFLLHGHAYIHTKRSRYRLVNTLNAYIKSIYTADIHTYIEFNKNFADFLYISFRRFSPFSLRRTNVVGQ